MKKFLLPAFVLLLAACNLSTKQEKGYTINEPVLAEINMPASGSFAVRDPSAISTDNTATETISEKIIRTATIRIQVNDLIASRKKIKEEMISLKGYVASETETNNYSNFEITFSIRIPNTSFDQMIEKGMESALFTDHKNISAEDVTSEFIDITGRLKTKKDVRNRYTELLNKADKVKDIIEVEEKLRVLQEEIESVEGRLKYLNDRVAYSTIDLTIYQIKPESQIPKIGFGNRIAMAINSGISNLQEAIIWLIRQWIWITIAVALLILWKRKRKK